MNRILRGAGEFFLLVLLSMIAPVAVYIDVAVMGNQISEVSVTEFAQEGLLLFSAVMMLMVAVRNAAARGFFLLVAGFFGVMLIREMDFLFDQVWHGFWLWPAVGLMLFTVLWVFIKCRDTVIEPMARFLDTKPWYFMMFGLVILLFFSRVFGSGSLLWKDIMGEEYNENFKAALQEGIELLGYAFIAAGSFLAFLRERQNYS